MPIDSPLRRGFGATETRVVTIAREVWTLEGGVRGSDELISSFGRGRLTPVVPFTKTAVRGTSSEGRTVSFAVRDDEPSEDHDLKRMILGALAGT